MSSVTEFPSGGPAGPRENSKEAFLAWAASDPEITAEIRELREQLGRLRARNLAKSVVYEEMNAEPTPPHAEVPLSRHEAGLTLGRLLALTEDAVVFLVGEGTNCLEARHRIDALRSVTRMGSSAAAIGVALDRLWAAPKPKRKEK